MPGQEAALRSASTQNQAQQNVQGEQALNARNAGGEQGGAATSGAVAAGDERQASGAAAQNSANQLNITGQNAQLAQQNVNNGLNGLGALSGQETSQSNSLGGQATNAAGQSFSNETQAYQPSNFWSGIGTSVLGMGLNAVAPGVGSLATGILGGMGGGSNNGNNNQNTIQSGSDGGYAGG